MMDKKNELVIERVFNAPINRVWKAWTDPKQIMKWWGPKNFTAPSCKIDLRVGGKYLYCMRGSPSPGAPAQDFWVTGTYHEIIPIKKLVCTDSFSDEHGNIVSAEKYGMKDFPLELEVTVTFEEINGKTKMTLRQVGIPTATVKEMTSGGWNESFDKLEASLKS
ncbi:SRPBCC domain-containing protein [Candidatus Micrarchaeota archaeon]|nr:SRPBCC domain-containing protein [Candidatus Micrarchaeota archaeon]